MMIDIKDDDRWNLNLNLNNLVGYVVSKKTIVAIKLAEFIFFSSQVNKVRPASTF